MSTVTREHLAGLQYALMVAEENWPNAALTEILSDLIAQASAAPEQAPTIFAIHGAGQQVDETCELALLDEANQYEPACVTALYTRPSAEIERLRAELAEFKQRHKDCLTRQVMSEVIIEEKLEEAQALLRERDRLIYGVIGATGKKRAEYLCKLHDLVSATAQPAEVKS